jgi:hypothetical protein
MSWTGGSIQHTSRQKNRTVTKDINIYIYIYIYIYKKKKKKKKKRKKERKKEKASNHKVDKIFLITAEKPKSSS